MGRARNQCPRSPLTISLPRQCSCWWDPPGPVKHVPICQSIPEIISYGGCSRAAPARLRAEAVEVGTGPGAAPSPTGTTETSEISVPPRPA